MTQSSPEVKAGQLQILVVDDHPAVREGLSLLIEAAGFGACFEAESEEEALGFTERQSLDLALVGLSMLQEKTAMFVTRLRARGIPVLVCSQEEGPAYVIRAMEAGARGYITKCEAPHELLRAVTDVLAGWILISPGAAEGFDDAWKRESLPRLP